MDTDINIQYEQNKVFYVHPTLIKVRDGLPRFRKELGAIEDLTESIRTKGQIQPVAVNRDMELIAGGRRLAACLLGNLEVMCVYNDAIDPILMRELEIEENVQRKPFTPSEEVLAVQELHRIKQEIYGVSSSGKEGGWTLDKTAEVIGKTRGAVIEDLKLAEALKDFPELAQCKTKSDIKRAVKTIENTMTRAVAATAFDSMVSKSNLPVTIMHKLAQEHMVEMEKGSVDLLVTDPPYGMDVFSNLDGWVGKNIGSTGFKYDDTTDQALILYQVLAKESFRFVKDNGHAYVFCCPEHFPTIQQYFRDAGWLVHVRPMIWIKRTSGQNNAPYHWPSSCYEMFMYARKSDSRLVKPGMADWLSYDPVMDSEKVHQAQKPIPLLRDIINRSVYPNSVVYDPFMGSASSLLAGLEEKCQVIGCDNLKEAYDSARVRLLDYQKELERK